MGARRQTQAGLVEEILNAAFDAPVAGLAALILFGGMGIVFRVLAGAWSQTPLTAMMFTVGSYGAFALAAVGLFGGLIGTVRCLITGRTLLGRSRHAMPAPDWNAVLAATPENFERIIADLYRRRGYHVREVGGPGDGGIDLILQRPGDPCEHLVQCKHYRVQSVGPAAVRELFGTLAAHPTRCEGILLTTGRFTAAARTFAEAKPLTLIDGSALQRLFATANPLTPVATTAVPTADRAPTTPPRITDTPLCPCCAVPMVRRQARRGRHAGQPFWGCVNYPRCLEIANCR